MKAVDFILELDDEIWFVEFKDPDNPRTQEKAREEFIENMKSGKLDADLTTKFRDSYLHELASGRADKPIHYLVLIALKTLKAADLLRRTEALRKQLPVKGPAGQPWNPYVKSCAVMDIATWNKKMPDYPISRRSERIS